MHLFDNMMRMMGLLINTHTHTHTHPIYTSLTLHELVMDREV